MSDFNPGDTVRLSGTKSEGTVVSCEGNSVTVKLADGMITTSGYQVELIKLAQPPAKKEAVKKAGKKKG